jgi:transposase InsO family protein
MDEDTKKAVAQFRFGVIADLAGGRKLTRGERERLLREKTVCEWEIPNSGRSYISRSTILGWVRRYEVSGSRIESLYPSGRSDRGKVRAMDGETATGLMELKRSLPGSPVKTVLDEARLRGIIPPGAKVSPATVYRLFDRHGLMETQAAQVDRRRFEAQMANDIWQSDCMHGPMVSDAGRERKSYLFAFLDDFSRLIPHGEFYLRENIGSYIDALKKALKKRGLPRKLYVDNGPTFRSAQLEYSLAALGTALVHSKPYQPQGRGKIERWFRTVRMQFLSVIGPGLAIDDLNERFREWVDGAYHATEHSSTGQTPLNRYVGQVNLVRQVPTDLDDYFRKRLVRKVDSDRTVSLLGRLYEAPVELIGKSVTLLFNENDPSRVEALHDSKSFGFILPLNLNVNCRVRRRQDLTDIVPNNCSIERKDEPPPIKGGALFRKGIK